MIFIAGGIKHSQAYHADPTLPWPSVMRSRAGVLSRAVSITGRSRSTTRQRNELCALWPWAARTISSPSDAGGERAAAIYTLLSTANLNGLDAELYLRHVLERTADHPINRIHELLPWNLAAL